MNFMSGSNVQISYRDENGEEIPADAEYLPDDAAMRSEDAAARRFVIRQKVNQPVPLYRTSQLDSYPMPSSNRQQFPINNFRLLNNEIQLVNPKYVASVRYDNRLENELRNVQQPPNSRISQQNEQNENPYGVKSSEGEEEVSEDKPRVEKVDSTPPLNNTDESVNEIVDIPVQDVGEAEDEAEQSEKPFIINEEEMSDDEMLEPASTNNFAYSYSHYVPHHSAQPVQYQQPQGSYHQQLTERFQQQQTPDYQRPANYYQHIIHYQPDPAENYIGKP